MVVSWVAPIAWWLSLSLSLAVVTSLVFGLLPAMRFSRPVIISALKDERHLDLNERRGRVRFHLERDPRATAPKVQRQVTLI